MRLSRIKYFKWLCHLIIYIYKLHATKNQQDQTRASITKPASLIPFIYWHRQCELTDLLFSILHVSVTEQQFIFQTF